MSFITGLSNLPDEIFASLATFGTMRETCALGTACRDLRAQAEHDYVWAHHPVCDEVRGAYPADAPRKTLAVATLYHGMHPSTDIPEFIGQEIDTREEEIKYLRAQIELHVHRQQCINADMGALLKERLGYVIRSNWAMQCRTAVAHDRLWEQNRENVITLFTARAALREEQKQCAEDRRVLKLKLLFESEYYPLMGYSHRMSE